MIDSIGDGLDDSPDVPESEGPSWFACPILPRSDMLAVIERHKALDGRAVNLFRNALKGQPRSDLFEHYPGRLIHWIARSSNTTKREGCKLPTES